MKNRTTSPASGGPAGPHFEAQVGAHYLLTMLAAAEPRGLPGTSVQRVAFQRAAEGRPLDDVVVHASNQVSGKAAVLEIQVKRTITFAPKDTVFRDAVEQIAEASRRPDFLSTRYELALATGRTSHNISGPYQDVLTWARRFSEPEAFITSVKRPGSANESMRTFVRTFKSHLLASEAPDDDATVWNLLRRLHILVFDFTATSSASEALAIERAVRVLHAHDTNRASSLWSSLIDISQQAAFSGGEYDLPMLTSELRRRSFRFAGDLRYGPARATLAEASANALEDIRDRVAGVKLIRHKYVAAVRDALNRSRFVEIRGHVGVGKSGVLKHFARQIRAESTPVVLSPMRTIPNGWIAMRAVIGFDGTARDLLSDLASGGAAALFVDNLDSFPESEQKTVVDLIAAAADVPGMTVIVTARTHFGHDEPSWLPSEALSRLGCAPPITVQELTDSEMDELRYEAPALGPLLSQGSPARDILRNLFHLDFQAGQEAGGPVPGTEIDMADRWWRTGGAQPGANQRERSRVLL